MKMRIWRKLSGIVEAGSSISCPITPKFPSASSREIAVGYADEKQMLAHHYSHRWPEKHELAIDEAE